MIFKRFELRMVLLISLSSLSGALFIWSLSMEYMRVTSAGLLIAWILLIAAIIFVSHRARQNLEQFLLALRNQDPSLVFPVKGSDPFFRKIHVLYNELISSFRLVRKEHQQEHQFFMHVINQIGIALTAFDQKGQVHLVNQAFLELFNLNALRKLSHLHTIQHDLPDRICAMKAGDKSLMTVIVNGVAMQLMVMTSAFRMNREQITLASFQDISHEMDQAEVETWQKLIRVLTHEIMNAISPLRLLASGLLKIIEEESKTGKKIILKGERLENIRSGLESIRNRSAGLNDFVTSYRSLTRLPKPEMRMCPVSGLFKEVGDLFDQKLHKHRIQLETNIEPEDLHLMANEQLIIQVLVNLVKNAMDAVAIQKKGHILLKAYIGLSGRVIEVHDNGPGIPAGLMDSIFTPFFTTREDGTGIGLSLAKQIMYVHQGSIHAHSEPGKGAIFKLLFKTGMKEHEKP
jgi:nitrogen fixation/metabolism regulation signal transduction histidine kinase